MVVKNRQGSLRQVKSLFTDSWRHIAWSSLAGFMLSLVAKKLYAKNLSVGRLWKYTAIDMAISICAISIYSN